MQTTMSEDSIITTRQAAQMLGVSVRTAQLWVETGVLEAWKTPGGHRRIRLSSIQKILSEQSGNEPPSASTSSPGRNVLLVEDDETLLRMYEMALGSIPGLKVIALNNAYQGLIKIGQTQCDLVITDLSMEGFDGFSMIKAIQTDPTLSNTRIIVVSGLSDDEIAERGGLPKGVALIRKPVSVIALEQTVRLLFGLPL